MALRLVVLRDSSTRFAPLGMTAIDLARRDFETAESFNMKAINNRSPRINHVSWGRLEVEGEAKPYKDAKLFPGGSREWNWRETQTSHRPGIQIADVQALAYKRNAFGL